MIYVAGRGNPQAKLMLVGEAPGKHEEEKGYPFAGPTGRMVDDLIHKAGARRDELYLTNVVKIRPPGNKLHRLGELGKSISDFTPQLWEEVHTINPNCILAIGNLALKTLTGQTGIKKWRGSILNSLDGLPKVVPTIHPASILHGEEGDSGAMMSWKDLTYIGLDFKRAVEESRTKELLLPDRLLGIARSELDLWRFLNRHQHLDKISADIESPSTIPLCISLAFNSYEALCVPLRNAMSATNELGVAMHDLVGMWKLLREFLGDKKPKIIGQNFKFDQWKLRKICHLPCPDPWFDTMAAMSVVYPELPKKLQFITSILTREPYYKDEYQDFNPHKHKIERVFTYCDKDACTTYEAYEVLYKDMEELGYLDFFFSHIMPMHRLYYEMDQIGLLRDDARQKDLLKKYEGKDVEQQAELDQLVGYEINVNSNTKQVPLLLFHDLKIPLRKDVGEDTLQSLLNNVVKDGRKRRIIELVLSLRKIKKTISTYIKAKPRECETSLHFI